MGTTSVDGCVVCAYGLGSKVGSRKRGRGKGPRTERFDGEVGWGEGQSDRGVVLLRVVLTPVSPLHGPPPRHVCDRLVPEVHTTGRSGTSRSSSPTREHGSSNKRGYSHILSPPDFPGCRRQLPTHSTGYFYLQYYTKTVSLFELRVSLHSLWDLPRTRSDTSSGPRPFSDLCRV